MFSAHRPEACWPLCGLQLWRLFHAHSKARLALGTSFVQGCAVTNHNTCPLPSSLLQQWKVVQAPEYMVHSEQVLGTTGTPRIRYPQIIDGRLRLAGDIHDPKYDDSFWLSPVIVSNGPWPAVPATSGNIFCHASFFAQQGRTAHACELSRDLAPASTMLSQGSIYLPCTSHQKRRPLGAFREAISKYHHG